MAIMKYEEGGKTYYRVDVRIGNQRPRRDGFRTREDAERWLNRLKEAAGGNLTDLTAADLDDVIVKYLEVISVNKSKTLQVLESRWFSKLSNYIKKVRRKKYLHEIDLLDLESYQAALAKHVSAGTVNRRFDSIKSLFNKCVDWGLLNASPARRLKRLAHRSERRKTWRKDEILRLHEALPKHYANLFWFIAVTGCRPGEARSLCWRDVDLRAKTVKLRSIKGGQGEMVREFPLTSGFLRFMQSHAQVQRKAFLAKPLDVVFPSRDGRAFDSTSLQKKVKKVTKKLKMTEGLCVYGLRHTYTTSLIEMDIALEKVRILVGHEKITTTQNYAHVSQKSLRVAAGKYDLRKERA